MNAGRQPESGKVDLLWHAWVLGCLAAVWPRLAAGPLLCGTNDS